MFNIQANSQRVFIPQESENNTPKQMQSKKKVDTHNFKSEQNIDATLQLQKKQASKLLNPEFLEGAQGQLKPEIIDFNKKMKKPVNYYETTMQLCISPLTHKNQINQLQRQTRSQTTMSQKHNYVQISGQDQISQILENKVNQNYQNPLKTQNSKNLSPYNTSFSSQNMANVLGNLKNQNQNQEYSQKIQQEQITPNNSIFLLKNTKKRVTPDHKSNYYKQNQESISHNFFEKKNTSRNNLIQPQTKLEQLQANAFNNFSEYQNYIKTVKIQSDDNLGGAKTMQTQYSYHNTPQDPESNTNLEGDVSPFTLTPKNQRRNFSNNSKSQNKKSISNNVSPQKTFKYFSNNSNYQKKDNLVTNLQKNNQKFVGNQVKQQQYFNKTITQYGKQFSNLKNFQNK